MSCPAEHLPPGRYLLDSSGTLHHACEQKSVQPVAAVVIRAKPVWIGIDFGSEEPSFAFIAKRERDHTPFVARPMARKPKATHLPAVPEVQTNEQMDDEAYAEFLETLDRVRKRREAGARVLNTAQHARLDNVRLAAALRAKNTRPAAQTRAPVQHAHFTGPCPRCGARGTVGCEHYLPYQGDAL